MTDNQKDNAIAALCAMCLGLALAIAYVDWERISGAYCSEYNWCFEERK
jgi:hypothetical protein